MSSKLLVPGEPVGIEPEELAKLGNFSEDALERLGWLVSDDEQQIASVRLLVGFCIAYGDYLGPQKSVQLRDSALEIAELADKLSDLINRDFPSQGAGTRHLERISKYYRSRAESFDPKGKATPRNHIQAHIAQMICDRISSGELKIEPRVTPNSDLSKLFRICCEAAGLDAPSNTSHYLSRPIKELLRENRITQMKAERAGLIEAVIRGDDLSTGAVAATRKRIDEIGAELSKLGGVQNED